MRSVVLTLSQVITKFWYLIMTLYNGKVVNFRWCSLTTLPLFHVINTKNYYYKVNKLYSNLHNFLPKPN